MARWSILNADRSPAGLQRRAHESDGLPQPSPPPDPLFRRAMGHPTAKPLQLSGTNGRAVTLPMPAVTADCGRLARGGRCSPGCIPGWRTHVD